MSDLKKEKQHIRDRLRLQLKDLTKPDKVRESAKIREALAESIISKVKKGSVIATYAGLDFEPDLIDLHAMLPDYHFVYPRCGLDSTLEFYLVNDPELDLVKGYYGIREPLAREDRLISHDMIDYFIIPAFAFTRDGLRLGKGGGYYDRVLENVSSKTPLVGAVFSIQILSQLPTEEHDISVSEVITG